MRLIVHFFIALPFVAGIFYLTQSWVNIALFFMTAFFIDIDHYIHYVFTGRGFSLLKAHEYYDGFEERYKRGEKLDKKMMVFHTGEFAIACVAFSVFLVNYYLVAGLAVHQLTDVLGDKFIRKIPDLRRRSILIPGI